MSDDMFAFDKNPNLDPVSEFEQLVNRIALMQIQIDKIDNTITKTMEFVEQIKDVINPLVDKISNNPLLKGFLS
jgi:hypothetical protein